MNKPRISFGHIEIGPIARKYLNEAIDRNWASEGPNVKKFEELYAAKFGYPFCIATSSGTDAGIVACSTLHEFGGERGDEIITPACAFVAAANCILAAGFTPKFVDVELETLNIDPKLIEAAIGPRTRGIYVVHTMGKPCKMAEIMAIAKKHNLVVIEDCCEAHGATLKGKVVGSFGAMGLFSFYAAHLVCSGEGGMISANEQKFAELCRSIRSHGRRGGQLFFAFDRVGYNSKMNDLEAAIGLEGMELFDKTFSKRRGYQAKLHQLLEPLVDQLILYPDGPDEVVCPHAYPITMRDPRKPIKELYEYMESKGIQCKTLFGSLPTQHRAFEFMKIPQGTFPVAERIGSTGLHFGLHQYLTDADIDFAADTIKSYFKAK